MAAKTKVINFRVTTPVYESYLKEAKKQKVTITDCILKKLDNAEKAEKMKKRIRELENGIAMLSNEMLKSLNQQIILMQQPAYSKEELKEFATKMIPQFEKLLK